MKRLLIAFVFITLLLPGCGRGPEVAPDELVEVTHPDLSSAESTIQQQIGQAREDLERARGRAESRRELANAFGSLGELYHAYDLESAAVACYQNAATLDQESFLWPYYLGVLAQEEGELEAAGEWFEEALERRAGESAVLLRLAEVALAQGDASAAGTHFEALLAEEEFAAVASYGLGRAAMAEGRPEAAVEHFEQALELAPEAGAIHLPLGQAYRQLDRAEEAEKHLAERGSGEVAFPDRVMERLEGLAQSSGAYLQRGNRDLMNGALDTAETALRRAVEIDPTNSAAHRNLAHALLQQGKVKEARDSLEVAVEQLPEDEWIHFDLGNIYLANSQAPRALRSFQRAVELEPTFAKGHFNLASTLVALERFDQAAPHLKTVLEQEPNHSRARLLDARIAAATGRKKRAIRVLRNLLEEEPTNLAAREELSKALERQNLNAAADVYRAAFDLDMPPEEQLTLRLRLGELFWRRGKQQDALRWWRKAVEHSPESTKAHTALANALQLMGKYEEARGSFARAVELDPENATAWLSEASLWILDSQFATAKERLEAALERQGDHPGLNNTFARLLATCGDPGIRDGQRALELARKAFTIEGSVDHAETIGMALAELGQFEEAIKWQRNLATQAAAANDRALATRLVQRLKMYERRQPVRIGS